MLKKFLRFVFDSKYRFEVLDYRGFYNFIDDENYLKKKFEIRMGKELNLENPVTFNEKLQWLKLYNRKDEYTTMVDKYEVRNYIREKIGEEYFIPLLGVWDKFEDIDFDKLPDQFVLKCTHDSGGLVICKDKNKLDINAAKEKINRCLKNNFYYWGREWPYKNVKPRIIAEKYMVDENGVGLKDYKIHNFNGTAEFVLVCDGRFSADGLTEDFYNTSWEHMPVKRPDIPGSKISHEKPCLYEKMIELSEILSCNIPFARTDFYVLENKIYFGEITFYPASGMKKFVPEEWDYKFGELIKLPER